MAQLSGRRASVASTATTSTQSSTDSFLDLVKNALETTARMKNVNRQVKKSVLSHCVQAVNTDVSSIRAVSTQATSDRLCTEVASMLLSCSQCLIRPTPSQQKGWSPAKASLRSSLQSSPRTFRVKAQPKQDLRESLLAYIGAQVATARRQGVRISTLTIVTNELSVGQLRRLHNTGNGKVGSGIRVYSRALGTWELCVGPTFKVHLIHSQLRRVSTRMKTNLSVTLEAVSKRIVALGNRQDACSKDLTDLYLLRAYFGTQLWLHEQTGRRKSLQPAAVDRPVRRPWYEVAAISFVEPYINACPKAKAQAQLGRRVVCEMGMGSGGDEEVELALLNEVLLQVISPLGKSTE